MKRYIFIISFVSIIFALASERIVTATNKYYAKHLTEKYLKKYMGEKNMEGASYAMIDELMENEELLNESKQAQADLQAFVQVTFIIRIISLLLIAYISAVVIDKVVKARRMSELTPRDLAEA